MSGRPINEGSPSSSSSSTARDGLPKQFVASMRTLFDIMDDRKLGYVHLADIESRWHEQHQQQQQITSSTTAGLPHGVVESLRKVTPPNGLLSFERFCAGLKICLLRNRGDVHGNVNWHNRKITVLHNRSDLPSQSIPPMGVGCALVGTHRHGSSSGSSESSNTMKNNNHKYKELKNNKFSMSSANLNTATVRPSVINTTMKSSSATQVLRTVSMPQLGLVGPSTSMELQKSETAKLSSALSISKTDGLTIDDSHMGGNWDAHSARSRSGIMTMLHNWHMGQLLGEQVPTNSGDAEGATDPQQVKSGAKSCAPPCTNITASGMASHHRRREPRRHTLANGIDYNMLKRMKQLEQEKDVLLQGVEAIDKARAWYLRQIVQVQDKMKYIGHGSGSHHQEYSMEAHQERLNFEMAQIFEVNKNLTALVESSERGFPMHMNLAVMRRQPLQPNTNRILSTAKQSSVDMHVVQVSTHENNIVEHNRQLSIKTERIAQLEKEKAALVRELFQARSHQQFSATRNNNQDTSFM